jgi:hypothetical protein
LKINIFYNRFRCISLRTTTMQKFKQIWIYAIWYRPTLNKPNFLLFSGRPWLFIFYGTMARIFIFKLFGPEYLFTKSASPLPSESNGRPLMAYSKLFYETARRARRRKKLILCFREGRIRIFYSSRLKCPWRVRFCK